MRTTYGTSHKPAARSISIGLTLLGSLLISMDVAIVNAIQPAIARSLPRIDAIDLSWTIIVYAITFAAVLVPAGRLADHAGCRRVFVAGLSLFAGGSLLCGLADTLPILLLGRVIQGLGAAGAQPASVGLLLAVTPPQERSVYMAIWGAAGAVGVAVGPVLGGALATLVSWRWAFLLNVALVACATPLVLWATPETTRRSSRLLPDPLGAFLLAGAAGLFTLGISQLTRWGLADPRLILCLGTGVILSRWFTSHCRHAPEPLLRLELLRDRRLALLTLATLFYAASFFGLLFSFVLFLTHVWRLSIVQAGLAITPMAGVVVLLCLPVGRLPRRFGFGPPLAAGATLMGAGLMLDTVLQRAGSFDATWVPVAALIGAGIACCYLLLAAAAVDGRQANEIAAVTAINQCARQLGAALGVSSAVAAIGAHPGASPHGFHTAWLTCAAFAAVAALAATGIRNTVLQTPTR